MALTLKQIKERGFVLYHDNKKGRYHIYTPKSSGRTTHGYSGTFDFSKRGVVLNGKEFKDVNSLLSGMDEFHSSLFRAPQYHDPMYRTHVNGEFLVRDELEANGWKHPGKSWYDEDVDAYELRVTTFGSEFAVTVYLTFKDDSKEIGVAYGLSSDSYCPVYIANCPNAESALYVINEIKQYVIQETVKKLVAHFDKPLKYNPDEVGEVREVVLMVDSWFRQWIALKTWEDLKETGEFDKKELKPFRLGENTLQIQQLLKAADMLDNPGIENENKYFLPYEQGLAK